MSPFRVKPGWTYKLKITHPDGRSGTFTCGTRDTAVANLVEGMVHTLIRKRKWEALDAVLTKRITLPALFDAYERKHLPGVEALLEQLDDTDLSPLVEELLDNDRYIQHVRRLIPAGQRYPASQFTTPAISAFLRGLTSERSILDTPSSAATRSRYKASLGKFAAALIERGIIKYNPVRDVTLPRGPKRRIVFLEPEQLQALVKALPQPFRALEAMMAGTGMEWSAVASVRRGDVDLTHRIIHARGVKNEHRERFVAVSEDWAWEIIAEYAKVFTPNALLFDGIRGTTALAMHQRESKALGLPKTTLHQIRHSFAVMHIKRGTDTQWIKNQLGHAPDSAMLYTIYGVYINAPKLTKAQAARLGRTEGESTAQSTAREVNS